MSFAHFAFAEPEQWADGAARHLLNAVVAPRPIAWVSTVDAQGRANLAPHSYFTVVSTEPPMVAFSSTGRKDTLRNVEETGLFTVNVASRGQVEAMNATSAPVVPEVDEFELAGVERVPGVAVPVPGVAGAPARLECVRESVTTHGNGHLVVGRVVAVLVDEAVLREGRIDPRLTDPVARLAGSDYSALGELFKIRRPQQG